MRSCVNANPVAVIIMYTAHCSRCLYLLGELDYADESWFNKDGNIGVCLCLPADATEMKHCQES